MSKARSVARGLRVTRGGGQRLGRRRDRRGHRVDVRFDRAVARLHLHLTRVEERQILFEREEMLGPVMAC